MPGDGGLEGRVVEAGRACSLTTANLREWASRGTPRQVEYLALFLEAERESREASRRAAPPGRCALPAPKTFDGHDWGAVSWPDGFGRDDLLSLSFLEGSEDLVLMGDVSCGRRTWPLPLRRVLRAQARGEVPRGVVARGAAEARA